MPRTPKAVALGRVLRQAREAGGLSLRDFAFRIDRDAPTLSRWETGERTPRPEHVARMLAVLGLAGARFEQIMTLAYDVDEPQWIATTPAERRQQDEAYLEYERLASRVVQVAPLVLPSLLQLPDVTAAVVRSSGATTDEVDERVRIRLERQRILGGQRPTRFTALIGMAALYQNVGGVETSIAQMDHLVAMARRPHIELRVTPFGLGWHPGLDGSFAVLESERLNPVVFVATRLSTLWLHRPDDVRVYERDVETIRTRSLSPDESIRLITERAVRLRTHGAEPTPS